MKNAILSLLALGLVACNGGSPDLPEMKGTLANHTPFPTGAFRVHAELRCYTRDFMGWRQSCGNDEVNVSPSEDGTYTVRALHVPAGSEYEFTLSLELPEKDAHGLIFSRRSARYDFRDEFKKIPEVANLSAFYLAEQKLVYRPASGIDSGAWANALGRDATVNYSIDFGATRAALYDKSSDMISGKRSASIETLPARIYFVNRALPADAPVTIRGELMSPVLNPQPGYGATTFATIERQLPFSSELPEDARAFDFDDSKLVVPTKSIGGQWKTALQFHDNYAAGSEMNWYDGLVELACVNGALQGQMHLESRGGNARQFAGDLPVRGSCEGERGTLEFDFQYSTNAAVQRISIAWVRIAGSSQQLLTNEVELHEAFAGHAFTWNLAIRDSQNRIVGRGGIDR